MTIEITTPASRTQSLAVDDVVLTRHLPTGDGTLTYLCTHCASVVAEPLTFEEAMAAVLAGAHPIDVDLDS